MTEFQAKLRPKTEINEQAKVELINKIASEVACMKLRIASDEVMDQVRQIRAELNTDLESAPARKDVLDQTNTLEGLINQLVKLTTELQSAIENSEQLSYCYQIEETASKLSTAVFGIPFQYAIHTIVGSTGKSFADEISSVRQITAGLKNILEPKDGTQTPKKSLLALAVNFFNQLFN